MAVILTMEPNINLRCYSDPFTEQTNKSEAFILKSNMLEAVVITVSKIDAVANSMHSAFRDRADKTFVFFASNVLVTSWKLTMLSDKFELNGFFCLFVVFLTRRFTASSAGIALPSSPLSVPCSLPPFCVKFFPLLRLLSFPSGLHPESI